MATSSNSKHHSRLIREMARDLNRHEHSCASSTGSQHGTVSDDSTIDFDPENEAIMSTRQMDYDFSQKLPEIRDTAKKYGRWNGGRQITSDFVIDTSAIGRAFPDFSQGGSSDESSFHVEVGRGPKTKTKQQQRPPGRLPRPEYSDNIDSPVVNFGDFKILSTPPHKGQAGGQVKATRQDSLRGSARKEGAQSKRSSSTSTPQKENIPPPPNPPSGRRMPDYVSGATRSSSGEQRRTLAEIHARVADESDASFVSDDRPATVTFQMKQSRFSNAQPKGSPLSAVHNIPQQQVKDALVEALLRHRDAPQETPCRAPRSQNNTTQNSNTVNQTNQSFLLPNMPDLSELVSGTFKDGAPVFPRNGKPQSRFASGSTKTPPKPVHTVLDSVPVPDEEKAIFLSLQLLQDKVAMLEMEKADAQRIAQELQQDNYQLQSENAQLQRHRRSDSALGMADSGSDGEYAQDNKKLIAEKTKLEAQVKSLNARLIESERTSSNQELRIKDISFEREQAVKQLAEAYYTTEQLQSDNELLQRENGELKLHLARLNADFEENTRQLKHKENDNLRRENGDLKLQLARLNADFEENTRKLKHKENDHLRRENGDLKLQLARLNTDFEENTRQWKNKETDLRGKLKRRDAAVSEMREMTQELQQSRRSVKSRKSEVQTEPTPKDSGSARPTTRGRVSIGQATVQQDQSQRQRSRSRSQARRISNTQNMAANSYAEPESFDIPPPRNMNDECDASDECSFDDTTKTIHKDINLKAEDRTQGSNYSSILGHGEMDRLREMLAHERFRMAEIEAGRPDPDGDDTAMSIKSAKSARSVRSVQSISGKSAKGLTGILKNRNPQDQDDTGRFSVKSVGKADEDNTSRSIASHTRRHSETSVKARAITRQITSDEMTSAFIIPDITLNGVMNGAQHPVLSAKAKKVLDTLCHHNGGNCTVCTRVTSFDNNTSQMKQTIRVEKPIPVSERMPVAGPYEDEPTMRPSVPPGLALATVMKGLEDELAHLKMELAQYQAVYTKHDPSLSLRKRKAVKAKIERLLKAIDIKADQIYALYDVLEGQKQSGQELSEKEVEVTLMDIGIDVDALKNESAQADTQNTQNEQGDSDVDSELDLPWEGIEDTTGSHSVNERRRSWAA